MKKILILIGMCIILSSFGYADTPTELYTWTIDTWTFNSANVSSPTGIAYNLINARQNATAYDNANYSLSGVYDNSATFDGGNDYLATPNSSIYDAINDTKNWSINLWVYPALNDTAGRTYIGTGDMGGYTNKGFLLAQGNSVANNRLWFSVTNGTAWDCLMYSTASPTINGNTWTMITVVKYGSNISFFLNGVFSRNISCTMPISNTKPLYIGNSVTLAQDFSGKLDEIIVFNKTINQTHIDYLYNLGSPGLIQEFPYGLGNLTTVNLVYPSNATAYNDYNGSIIFNSTATISCVLNDTRWNLTSTASNTTLTWINNTGLTETNYSLYLNCSGSGTSPTFWFRIDTTHPNIYQYHPSTSNTTTLNLSISTNASLTLNITANDSYLYQTNLTMFNATGYIYYNNYSGVLSGVTGYVWSGSLTNLTPSRYTIIAEASDSHTDKKIKSFSPKQSLTERKIEYKSTKEWGNIDFNIRLVSSDIELNKLSDTKKIDRHSPEFGFDVKEKDKGKLHTYTFEIHSSRPLDYIKDSEYIGHFASHEGMRGIWYDSMFDGYEGSQFNIYKVDDYTYQIEIKTTKINLRFNSLGGLNYNSVNSTFEVLANVSIYAQDEVYGNYLSNFSVTINGTTQNTTGNNSIFYLLANTTYSVSINKTGTNNPTTTFTTNFSSNQNISVQINTTLLQVFVYDEVTGSLITANITGLLFNPTYYNYSFFSGGRINYTNLVSGLYTYKASSVGYSPRSNDVVITDGVMTNLTMYLLNTSTYTVFTIRDNSNPNNIIENATMTISKYINSTYTLIAIEYSDVTGRITHYYVPSDKYYFTVTKTNYQTKTFELIPQYSDYSVYLVPLNEGQIDYGIYNHISIEQGNTTFYNNANTTYYVKFYSPYIFTSFGYNASFPSSTCSNSSTVSSGATLTCKINVTGATIYDTVNITIYYTINGSTVKSQTFKYKILQSHNFGTWVYASTDSTLHDYGLLIGDRILLATILIILFGGVATFFGNMIIGSVVGLFMMGFFAYIGFLPVWFVYMPLIIGFIILIWRGTQS